MDNATNMPIVAVFEDRARAETAINELHAAGFNESQVGLLRKGELTGDAHEGHDHARGTASGLATGAVEGGILGALAAFVIPGAGPFIGAGILGTTLLGAVTGAATGGIAGALTGMGIHKDDAEYYNREVETGKTLVSVRGENRVTEAREILRRCGGMEREGAVAGSTQAVR